VIGYISGNVIKRFQQRVIVQTAGVGYIIAVPDETLLGKQVELWIYTHWSQEQGPTLYGFMYEHDMHAFSLLIQAPGVGPQTALSGLCNLSAHAIVSALANDDAKLITHIPGIGLQKAKKIMLHLHEKAQEYMPYVATHAHEYEAMLYEVRQALAALGYQQREIAYACSQIQVGTQDRFDVIMRKALACLAQQ